MASTTEDRKTQLMATVVALGTPKFNIHDIAISDVARRLEAKDPTLVLLDTRTDEERNISTIPGSISKAEFDQASAEEYKDKEIVTFCTVGYLSGAYACELVQKKGFDAARVHNLGEGALLGWTLEGRPLVKPDGSPSTEVHTFMGGLGSLAGDGLTPVFWDDAEAGAKLEAANKHIAEVLGL